MGMYTEMIFGATLKKDTPENVIEIIKYLVLDREDKPEDFPFKSKTSHYMLRGASCSFVGTYFYFMVSPSGFWELTTRSNVKACGEFEEFLAWIKPYIDEGVGMRDLYAQTLYEEDSEPTMYYLREEY